MADMNFPTALPDRREPSCPNSMICCWQARHPAPAGFALIVPDNLDMLQITAGEAQWHHLHQSIGQKLETVFGSDSVTGSGSMEGFLVALGSSARAECIALMNRVLEQITAVQLEHGGHSCALTARAGIIWNDGLPTIQPELLRRKLVSALVAARQTNRSCVAASLQEGVVAGEADIRETEITAQLLCDLPAAMTENRLLLSAQDILACTSRPDAPHEVEILLQMRDRDGNEFSPSKFLPEAEKTVLIEMVDRWVLRRVLIDFGPQLAALPKLLVSINVSAPSLDNPDFAGILAGILRHSLVSPCRVQLEITETSVIRDMDKACTNIREARRLGCRIALDDFGSGMSSYGYLKAFEPDCIKIDGALITNVADPENVESQIVRSIIDLAHRLGIEVVAEHVSSPEILNALRGFGIDKVQGYEIGRPRPLSQLFATPRSGL